MRDLNLNDPEHVVRLALESSCGPVTTPETPQLELLQNQVQRRRTKRRLWRTGSVMSVVVLLLIGFQNFTHHQESSPESAIAQQPGLVNAEPGNATASHRLDSSAPLLEQKHVFTPEPKVYLHARVRHQVPLIRVNMQTINASHVGWIEQEWLVPIDIDQFTEPQVQLLRTFTTPDRISL